jgi:hypothetical protein
MRSSACRVVFVFAMCACAPSSIGYLAPPSGTNSEASLGGLDVALASALRASYRGQAHETPPVQLTPAEGNELELRSVDAAAEIDGVLAHTHLHFVFHNPEARVREGRFSVTLPASASVGRFAMRNADGWREARVVARQKGREVYERFLHHRVDPALLEQDLSNTFSARVFPISASADKEIIIEYDQRVAPATPYVLALRGLPRGAKITATIDHAGHHQVVEQPRDIDPEDITIPIDSADRAVVGGDAFAARVETHEGAQADSLERTFLLVDTSASRAPLMSTQAQLVRALLARIPATTSISIAVFDQGVTELYRGPAGEAADVANRILEHGALGASDLGGALARAAAAGARRVVVIGDAAPTAGEADPARLGALVRGTTIERLDTVQLGQALDRDTAQAITSAGQRAGAMLDGREPSRLFTQLTTVVLPEQSISVEGATAVWPSTTKHVAPGDPVWIFGTRASESTTTPLVAHIGSLTMTLVPSASDSKRVTCAVAGARIEELSDRMATADATSRTGLAAEIEVVALDHGLVSSQTSLLVLENDRDEAQLLGGPPMIHLASTTQAVALDTPITEIAVPGRTFDGVIGALAGSTGDDLGVAFSGKTSLENEYIVDGKNVAGLTGGGELMVMGGESEEDASEPPEPEYAPPYAGAMLDVMTAIARRDRRRALEVSIGWQLKNPGDIAALLALGEALEARGATTLAARVYGSVMDLYPRRSELLRAAGERLDRVPGARALAIDAYRRAIRERPDQVSTYRLLAYDLMLDNQPEALDVLFEGMRRAQIASVLQILTEDNLIIGSYLLVHASSQRDYVRARLRGTPPRHASVRFVLSWETDANDVDLHVWDRSDDHAFYKKRDLPSGGGLLDDITDGFGPEMFEVDDPDAFPYRLGVHYYARGPEGIGLGTVQVIRYDGPGRVSIENRPFVLQNDNARVDLGEVERN